MMEHYDGEVRWFNSSREASEEDVIEKSARYSRIGKRLLQTSQFDELASSGARIAFLSSDKEKRKDRRIIFADCRKVNEQYAWCCPYDFMITVYEPNVLSFSRKQIEILLTHELMHCGVDWDQDDASFYLVPHDIEEFYAIIDKYGMDWQKEEI